ncbi:hypothetical protein [Catellatospora chokoriensis]|uniref:Uncharacterized protein n=1 Tax=Catellatospora chokoriensis TaxID=310353 RepID=A0A8J3NP69_9ACTN|nr:hypothetical protein [Catellatospora chokoriensis]GIF87700.1 hypothetical protein Cch02nite_11440 [Catellatospora chokoriensis]
MVEQQRPATGSRGGALSAIATVVSTVVALLEFLTDLGALAIVLLGVTALAFAGWGLVRSWTNRQAVPAAFLVLAIIAVSAAVGAAGDRLLRPEQTVVATGQPGGGLSPTPGTPTGDPGPTGLPSASAPAPSTSAPASPQVTGAAGQPTVKRTAKGVTLPTYYSMDLDSDAPNWGVVRNAVDGWDIRGAVGVGVYGIASYRDLTYVSGEPTHETCVAATALQRGIEQEKTRAGTAFCVKTGEGRWAWVKITGVNKGSGEVTLDLHVWEAAA